MLLIPFQTKVELITGPTGQRMTTLAMIKARLDIGERSDADVNSIILGASRWVERFCSRNFAHMTVDQTWRTGNEPVQRLICQLRPMTTVSTVTEDGDTLTTDDYEVDKEAGIVQRLNGSDEVTEWGKKVVIRYAGGYVLPGAGGTRTLPEDLEEAVIEVVKAIMASNERDAGIRREKILDVYEADYINQLLPGMALDTLKSYRSFV